MPVVNATAAQVQAETQAETQVELKPASDVVEGFETVGNQADKKEE